MILTIRSMKKNYDIEEYNRLYDEWSIAEENCIDCADESNCDCCLQNNYEELNCDTRRIADLASKELDEYIKDRI